MSDTITLEELSQTEIGQAILAQRDEKRGAEQAQADSKRAENVAAWQADLSATAIAYEALRGEALRLLGELAPHAARLVELRARLRTLRSFIVKNGAEVADFPEPAGPGELRKVTEAARKVLGDLGGGL